MRTIARALALFLLFWSVSGQAQDFQKGMEAFDQGDFQTALEEWRPLAEQGDADAQFGLGVLYGMYGNGYGFTKDYTQVAKWYRLAFDQVHPCESYSPGTLYHEGNAVPQDYTEAAKWYRLAAEQGNAYAQFNLGWLYYHGTGVIQSYIDAHMWFNIAASAGNESAKGDRDRVATEMSQDDLVRAQRLARECLERQFKDC